MNWNEKFNEWKSFPNMDDDLKKELMHQMDEKELEDRFYRYLEFGTGGMRGLLGAGTNRINIYTIKRVALALARHIIENDVANKKKGVVIAYDNRNGSPQFAEWTARVLASYGIKVYLSDELRPTPELSFLVRHFGACFGVMITASHNPKEYNGFKVYGEDGGQITLEIASELTDILSEINNELFINVEQLSFYIKQGLITIYSKEVDELYIEKLQSVIQNHEMVTKYGKDLNILYTPLHGTGKVLIENSLNKFGFTNLTIISEQAIPDPDFSTVKSPNPEDRSAYKLALIKAKEIEADIILATDPDSDRLGVVVFEDNEPIFLNGNQIGVLLLDYLIDSKKNKGDELDKYFIAKTIVTSDLGNKISQKYGIQVRETLTGFKFIGEQIELSKMNGDKEFLLGFEESYGYLIEPFVRDKDAIQAALLLVEICLDCKILGHSLIDRLQAIYEEFGYYYEQLETIEYLGENGIKEMNSILNKLRNATFESIGSFYLEAKEDYLSQLRFNFVEDVQIKLSLPKSNVLKFIFLDGSWICLRPSGTEPKFKIYYSVNAENRQEMLRKMNEIQLEFNKILTEV